MDYARFLSRTALRRQPSPIRALQPLVSRPGMISLGGGMPNPSLFPFTGISLEVAGGHRLQATAADVREALQYSPTPGLPELVSRLSRMQQGEHAPAAQVSTIVVPGSQDGLAKLFDALLEEGDALLVEEPTYSGSLAYLQGKGCALVGVPTDAGGIDVAALSRVLGSWDSAARGGKRRPRVLYTIPTGSNPTGASQSEARKRELLAVAREFDLLLIEDDPCASERGGTSAARVCTCTRKALGAVVSWRRTVEARPLAPLSRTSPPHPPAPQTTTCSTRPPARAAC